MVWSRENTILWPLVGGVIVALAVLGTVMFRSSFQLGELRERSVVEATLSLANDKAEQLEKQIINQDNTVLSLTSNESLEEFGAEWLSVAATQTPTVRAAVLIDLETPAHEILAYASRAPGPDDDVFRRRLLSHFWAELNLGGPELGQLRHLHIADDSGSYLLSHWQRTERGSQHLVVLWHDVPRIVHDVFPSLYGEAEGQPSRVNVVDAEGRIVYGPPLSKGSLTLGRQFATTLYKWRVNVSMIAADTLAAEVEQRRLLEMALVGFSSLVVLVGLLVIIVAANRERKLAMLKSEFVANVSHELKTPLALVRMFGELLQSGRASKEKQSKYLEIIVTESERLSALIDNVLDFARVEQGKTSYEFKKVSLAGAVTRAVDICLPRAERQQVSLRLQLEPEADEETRLDERAIEIALINLIDNALKYAEGTKTIEVTVRRSGRHYLICVEDEGPGIPGAQRRRIFERFVRGEATTGEAKRGSGIGLSLVAQIAQAHGGRAWVESREKRGACFCLTVKAAR